MPSPATKRAITASLACADIQANLENFSWQSVRGGSINQCFRVSSATQCFFVKINDCNKEIMFAAEADGLKAIDHTQTMIVPKVYTWGSNENHSWLILSYLALKPHDIYSQHKLGEQLAAMHHVSQEHFGWHRDNTIGLTPQINTLSQHWVDFYGEQRLGFQLNLAKNNGFTGSVQDKGAELIEKLTLFFSTYSPKAALLHGDLWGGNHASDGDGNPVIYDPAIYCGDREADIAMTELFGGCSKVFYDAYHAHYPLDEGYSVRKNLYNLYHILNHANLFGSGYIQQAENMMDELLSNCAG